MRYWSLLLLFQLVGRETHKNSDENVCLYFDCIFAPSQVGGESRMSTFIWESRKNGRKISRIKRKERYPLASRLSPGRDDEKSFVLLKTNINMSHLSATSID